MEENSKIITGREAERVFRDLRKHPENWMEIVAIVIGRDGCSYLEKDYKDKYSWRHEHELLQP